MRLDARFRHLIAWLLALAIVSAAHPALAEDAPQPAALESAPNPEATPVTRDTSYSGTVAIVYGIGYAASGAGWILTRQEPQAVRLAGAVVLPSGVITTLFGPMLTHFDNGSSLGKGLLSAGGQVVALAAGIGAGYGVASLAGEEEAGNAMLIGAVSTHAGWAVFDTLVLARDERVVERTIPAPTYALSLEPALGRGVRLGASFRF